MQRTELNRQFSNAMVERGIDIDRHYFGHQKKEQHPSEVIESIDISYEQLFVEPYLYFAALYIVNREEAKGIDLPYSLKECIRSIELAKKDRKN